MTLIQGQAFGIFRIVEPLGRGGMAAVYKAHEPALDRHVALKILPQEFLHDPAFAERFRQEAKVIARLEHRHIVPIYAFGIDEGIPWMSMRLITGGTLSMLLKQGKVDARRVIDILIEACEALEYAHARGVLHRDVKPQNILLDEEGHAFLADFGIAKMVEGATVLTKTGMISGTPQYMSPEQAKGEKVDHRTDIYALGIMAYEAFTGRVPFSADTPVAVLMKQVMEPIPVPSANEVPDWLMRPVLKALAKQPESRWSSATAFGDALRKALLPPDQSAMGETIAGGPPVSLTAPTAPALVEDRVSAPAPTGPAAAVTQVPSPTVSPTAPAPVSAAPLPPAQPVRQRGILLPLPVVGAVLAAVGVLAVGVVYLRSARAKEALQTPLAAGTDQLTAVTPPPQAGIEGINQVDGLLKALNSESGSAETAKEPAEVTIPLGGLNVVIPRHRSMRSVENVTCATGRNADERNRELARAAKQDCEGGTARSCTRLGGFYEHGCGLKRDLAKAIEAYRKGCEGGDGRACTYLGAIYEDGDGTAKDLTKAIELYRKACAGTDDPVCDVLKGLQQLR